jgi:hypothetical protein
VRITAVEEDDEGTLAVTAEDFFGSYNPNVLYPKSAYVPPPNPTILGLGGATSVPLSPQLGTGTTVQNNNQQPGPVNAPVIFEPPSGVLSSGLQVWIALSGMGVNWGGAQVWVSSDGSSYSQLGLVVGAAVMGVTTAFLPTYAGANPDAVDTLSVNLSESAGTLSSFSAADAANLISLCYVGGEFVAYQAAELTNLNRYDLTTLYRGAHATPIAAHAVGSPFVFMTPQTGRFSFLSTMIGQTIYLKFLSFNQTFGNVENIAFVTAYPYTITGAGLGSTSTAVPAGFVTGSPTAGQTVQLYTFTAPTVLPAGLAGSQGTAGTAATGVSVFAIDKNGVQVGTMTFAVGSAVASFAMAVQTAFDAGDVLTVTAPSPPDATLANISWTLAGSQTA